MTRCKTFLPAEITAGLDFRAVVCSATHPAPDWVVRLVMRGAAVIDLEATASGTEHVLFADAATTAAWFPGDYWFSLRASKGSEVAELSRGRVVVLQDLASVTESYDGRTQNEIALEALDAVLAKKATRDQMRYVIGTREIWRMSVADMLKLRSYYSSAVRRERARQNGCSTFGRPINVRFKSP